MRLLDAGGAGRRFPLFLVLPLFAFVLVLPLLWNGPSCGHDFGFHLQSWMDASAQMRAGHPFPRWAFSPAFNAGEPRFLFYPPLSWLLGSVLMLVLPASLVPAAFTWLALTGAAFGMYGLARRFTEPPAACLAAAVYLANPYLLFTALERTAYGELLAAAWMPLLFRAVLHPEVANSKNRGSGIRPIAVAVPLALLWLSNAPAAVMGTYALVLLILLQLALDPQRKAQLLQTLWPAAAGLALGLGLAGFYLLPAAWERRYVQIAMAIIPNMRVEDNFLFGHTGYGPHDAVLHTASMVAVWTLGLTALVLLVAALPGKRFGLAERTAGRVLASLGIVAAVLTLLLWQGTLPVWHGLPELAFLQFPWRLMSVLGCVLGLGTALAAQRFSLHPAWATALALGFTVAGITIAFPPFRQGCEAEELPAARVARFNTHHGVGGTDEYTPITADNDQLRWDDPAWWLADTLNAPGPGTVPNPASAIEDYDQPPPLEQTVAGFAPRHLALHLDRPQELVLNLRDYPAWEVKLNGKAPSERLRRDDGLLALALPAGTDTVDIRWRTLPDIWAGDALTAVSLLAAAALARRSRRMGS